MDLKRAREITSSLNLVDVTHNGVSIYIDSILDDNATALVHATDQPKNHHLKVSIASLIEGQ